MDTKKAYEQRLEARMDAWEGLKTDIDAAWSDLEDRIRSAAA